MSNIDIPTFKNTKNPIAFPVLGGAALVAFAVLATTVTSVTGIGAVPPIEIRALESKDLVFESKPDGAMLVHEIGPQQRDRLVQTSHGEGFVRVAVESFKRARESGGVPEQTPFRLVRQADGRLWLEDPATHLRVALNAFGPSNARVFAKFFTDERAAQ